jgi:hypothetical protein
VKPTLGSKGILLLRHLATVGPLTPRQGGKVLHPDAKGGDGVRGTGRGNTDARGTANRAAGMLLGHMARAGWVAAGQGERYAIPYSITEAGREALRGAVASLEADPLCGPNDPVAEGRKRCGRCGRARLASAFARSRETRDGLARRCRSCGSETQAERRGALLVARDAEAGWQRASKEVIVSRCIALIRAARVARRVGMWRGRGGIRAYAALGVALDSFAGSASKDLSASAADACDAFDTRSPDHADPSDADWSPGRHGSQPWLNERAYA